MERSKRQEPSESRQPNGNSTIRSKNPDRRQPRECFRFLFLLSPVKIEHPNLLLEDFMQETAQQYIQRILGFVDGKDPLQVQRDTPKKLQKLLKPLSKKQLTQRPGPGKWSVAEILAHLADAELVGGWRMRLIVGNNGVSVQPFDQDVWAETFAYAKRDPAASLEAFRVLRENNLAMLKALPKNLWENYGMHQERGKETITHIVRMFAGHDLNHLEQVEKIAKGSRSKQAA
jgi:uncharacterized damage-inducible protein DinB